MKKRTSILVVTILMALAAGSVAVYAYDSSREDTVANGVTIGGVDVGGLSAEEARDKVRAEVAPRIEQPIVVAHGRTRFTLSTEDARVRADVGGMVADAIDAGRGGNPLGRAVRDLTGGEEDAQIAARATYSRAAADRLVRRVRDKLDRPARDASLDFPSLDAVEEQDGIEVRRGRLARLVAATLASGTGDRTVAAPVKTTKPKVTRDELAQKYPVVLVADRSSFQLRLYKDLKLADSYTVAFGAIGFDTPAGLYHIQNKAVNPTWNVPNSDWAGDLAGTSVPGGSPDNPLKARWLGIFDGAGIHGTDDTGSLGSAASHGCIRMAIPDVIDVYDRVAVGTPIYIG